ncbi:cell division protein ZapA [candidate division WOR-3 bacterium]|uniref:Cell division protein ZapA n=1 Tax=candidate division WOR-3 bacterium TaxID=2052148 RepID=A0A9D5K8M9_UNCW3|nr:cell division protein ZapA [candidate division WOR-3 bacterium]MBD3364387.1 cell division protein ZapA [candidate division WOR-3 bacterium]
MAVNRVKISGYEIQVRHDTTPERLTRLASWIDKLIREKKEKFGKISIARCALLVALELADKLDQQRDNLSEEFAQKLKRLTGEINEVI